jgi:arsenite-transporting ATPase
MAAPPFPATRILFFTGKGGVGKTSLACATAIALADDGRRVLLVSTDPASNLDEVLETALSARPRPVSNVQNLFALNIDPERAAAEYRERVVGPYRSLLPAAAVARMEEQLSGACTVEIAAFDQFTGLLADTPGGATVEFDHVVFDTAPTGHTLRLLKLPAAWTTFMDANTTGSSCLGPLSGLQAQRAMYEAALAALADPARTTVLLVARPDASSLAEAARSGRELAALGIANQRLIVNGIFAAAGATDPVALALDRRGRAAVAAMPAWLAALPRVDVRLRAFAPIGAGGLRRLFDAGPEPDVTAVTADVPALAPPLLSLVDLIEADGPAVILTMGKGGVGKTTVAAAIATELARRGHAVSLSTTDPAAHVATAVKERVAGLDVSRIDPGRETEAYRAEVLAANAGTLDERGRALLEEDLRSPCTEEVAVFRAFARTVAQSRDRFVVLDTAPTGHTLLLLDAARAYHREVERARGDLPDAIAQLLPTLRDGTRTKVLVVTVPEATPVHEAARLQAGLRRAGIEPFAWVVNQCLSAASRSPVLRARAARQVDYLRELRDLHASRLAAVSWMADEPVGPDALGRLTHDIPGAPNPTVNIFV